MRGGTMQEGFGGVSEGTVNPSPTQTQVAAPFCGSIA